MTYDFSPRIYENVAECNYEYFAKERLRGRRTSLRWSCDWKTFSLGWRYNVVLCIYLGPVQLTIDRHNWHESPQEFMRRTNLLIRGLSFISANRIAEGTIMANRIADLGDTLSVKKPPLFEMYTTTEKPEPQDEQ
jgi:hypothetical protein